MTQNYPSHNHNERRLGPPDMIVIHYTDMTDWDETHARLCDPAAEVSAHWLIGLDGRAAPLVDEARRAWHAGVSSWEGERDVNSRSIGVELMNAGHTNGLHPFPAAQMDALERLLGDVMARWGIAPENVVGHEHVAPGRKVDPGPKFDWARLRRLGLSRAPGG